MKTMKNLILLGTFAVAMLINATGQQPETPKDTKQPDATTPKTGEQPPLQAGDKPAAEAGGPVRPSRTYVLRTRASTRYNTHRWRAGSARRCSTLRRAC